MQLDNILVIAAAFLSLVASSLFLVYLWPKRKEMPTLADVIPYQMLFYITITDIVGDIFYIIGGFLPAELKGPNSAICIIQAVGNTGESISKLFWVTAIAINYFYVFKKKNVDSIINYKFRFFAICIGIPILFSIALVVTNSYKGIIGDVTLWCWITGDFILERIIFFYGWLILCYILCISLYCSIFCLARKGELAKWLLVKFTFYILAFMITWTAAFINRIFNWINLNVYPTLNSFQAICEPLQGFLLTIVYGIFTLVEKRLAFNELKPFNKAINYK